VLYKGIKIEQTSDKMYQKDSLVYKTDKTNTEIKQIKDRSQKLKLWKSRKGSVIKLCFKKGFKGAH